MDDISSPVHDLVAERQPLLPTPSDVGSQRKKRFYRPRPLWLVPFAVTAALVRGMTIAPRVQVFTQLSCASIYQDYNLPHSHTHDSPLAPASYPRYNLTDVGAPVEEDGGYILIPSSATPLGWLSSAQPAPDRCHADPAVQSRAARLQTTFMIITGLTSALTNGWWGHFGEKHGRMRVLAIGTLGLLISDLMFVVVSNPNTSIDPAYGHALLTIAPLFEGLTGGWSSLQGTTAAYLSDCTSDGKSRARVFSRFSGMFYVGFAIGPTIGAWFIRHPVVSSALQTQTTKDVTSVFYVAAFCSLVNLLLALFVFPESLHSKSGPPAPIAEALDAEEPSAEGKQTQSIWADFAEGFSHALFVFAPREEQLSGGRKRKNWSLPLLASALSGYFLASGVFQIKYLYAGHVFGWESDQLAYYIFLAGGLRAVNLLFVMPLIISLFKPKPLELLTDSGATTAEQTAAQHAKEMQFDLTLTRASFAVDVLSHTLVSLAPATAAARSQWMFVCFSVLSSFGSGVVPTVQSLALGLFKASGDASVQGRAGAGKLFGAIAALQAVFQIMLGPTLFALVYSVSVAAHPKAIFNCAAGILLVALVLISFVRTPKIAKAKKRRQRDAAHIERGRSRRTKDLRGAQASDSSASTSR